MKKNVKLPDLTNQHIITTDYEDEMKQSYIDYAMSVIAARALPDIRDGLKPVQRRTLYAMKDLNVTPDKPYRKCARIVGDTMGKYHPHGDGSIYNSMVRMAQDFTYKEELIDGHGNFGSIDGDGAAAMRYTEARLKPISLELLEDIDKDIVEMKTNFDETLMEPTILPAKFPNALVNGMTGIAVGMSTNFPTHNLGEIIDGTIAYINNEDITIKELMTYIKGPDFPTGGIIANKDQLESIYSTGKGKIKIRAKIDIEKINNGKSNIVIREIPYTLIGNKSMLIENLVDLVRNKKLNGIQDIRDESSRGEIEIIIETKKDVDPYRLVNKLYGKTRLEDNFSVNMLALHEQKPYLFNLKSAIQKFVEFQQDIYTKRYRYLLDQELDKKEGTEGLLKAYDEIDIIIEAIRGAKNAKTVKNCLITGDTTNINFRTKKSENRAKKFNYTERQATIILEMRLYKLVGLEKLEVEKQYKQIMKKISRYEKILSNKNVLNKTIISELQRISDKYTSKRKTVLKNLETLIITDEKIVEDVYVLVDDKNYIKSIDMDTFDKNKDKLELEMTCIIKATTEDKICLFDNRGYLYKLKVGNIPKTKLSDKGTAISVLTQIDEKNIIMINKLCTDDKLLFLTKYGLVKQVDASEFNSSRSKITATKLNDDDSIIKIISMHNEELLITVTANGFALIIKTEEVPNQKRTAKGVNLIKLNSSDHIVDVAFIDSEQKTIQINVDDEINKKNISAIGIKKRNSKGKQIFPGNKNIIGFS
ncbi:DNA gyrase subunit A [Vallitalea longa]|uniref:DNA topoisomerase (ATP-hydrolyzing) n=1 Tax=Vallitalea longa TaxID=2936439 RepID=A0A9W5YAF4_9FIRM|nr:DNA topoisomerase (ATP-hydrolyzing) [Vallitalea longa]GKX28778.1 DNA gyrase subunit A [Vallitalea longa]